MPANEKDVRAPLTARLRPWFHGFTFALIFSLTAAELGIDSHVLHSHGNDAANYPGLEFKNIIGLILFTCIATLLYTLSHYWSSVRFSVF